MRGLTLTMPRLHGYQFGRQRSLESTRRELGLGAKILPDFRRYTKEDIGDLRVELGSPASQDFLPRRLQSGRLTVRPVRGHRIQRIGERKQSSAQRNLLSRQAVGISQSIEAFVMVPH